MKRKLTVVFFLLLSGLGYGQVQTGKASYYAKRFAGHLTANGERFNPEHFTAANLHLPFGTKVLVTNLANNKSVVVRINDRGPYVKGRIIDLSRAAAKKLGFIKKGVTDVALKVVPDNTPLTGKLVREKEDLLPPSKKKAVSPSADSLSKAVARIDSVQRDTAIVEEGSFFTLQVKRSKPKGYGIQIGSFKETKQIFPLIDRLKTKYHKKITLEVRTVDDTTVYSLILGDYTSYQKAEDFKEKVRDDYAGAFVVNFGHLEK